MSLPIILQQFQVIFQSGPTTAVQQAVGLIQLIEFLPIFLFLSRGICCVCTTAAAPPHQQPELWDWYGNGDISSLHMSCQKKSLQIALKKGRMYQLCFLDPDINNIMIHYNIILQFQKSILLDSLVFSQFLSRILRILEKSLHSLELFQTFFLDCHLFEFVQLCPFYPHFQFCLFFPILSKSLLRLCETFNLVYPNFQLYRQAMAVQI